MGPALDRATGDRRLRDREQVGGIGSIRANPSYLFVSHVRQNFMSGGSGTGGAAAGFLPVAAGRRKRHPVPSVPDGTGCRHFMSGGSGTGGAAAGFLPVADGRRKRGAVPPCRRARRHEPRAPRSWSRSPVAIEPATGTVMIQAPGQSMMPSETAFPFKRTTTGVHQERIAHRYEKALTPLAPRCTTGDVCPRSATRWTTVAANWLHGINGSDVCGGVQAMSWNGASGPCFTGCCVLLRQVSGGGQEATSTRPAGGGRC